MPFSLLSNTLYGHPAFGLTAKYYADGAGGGVDVAYLNVDSEAGVNVLGHDFTVSAKRIKVRRSDIADIQDGDVFEIAGQKYYVKGDAETVRGDWLIEFGGRVADFGGSDYGCLLQ